MLSTATHKMIIRFKINFLIANSDLRHRFSNALVILKLRNRA